MFINIKEQAITFVKADHENNGISSYSENNPLSLKLLWFSG